MNYVATAEAFLRELGTGKEAKEGKEAPLNSLNSLNSPGMGSNAPLNSLNSLLSPPKWKRGDRLEVGHLSTQEQTAIIRRMIETGAVLVLEGEDGVTYRCHKDGADLPEEAAGLPRYQWPDRNGTAEPTDRAHAQKEHRNG